VSHRQQQAVLLQSALMLRMTPNHASHPTVNADAGKQLTTTLAVFKLKQTQIVASYNMYIPQNCWICCTLKFILRWIDLLASDASIKRATPLPSGILWWIFRGRGSCFEFLSELWHRDVHGPKNDGSARNQPQSSTARPALARSVKTTTSHDDDNIVGAGQVL